MNVSQSSIRKNKKKKYEDYNTTSWQYKTVQSNDFFLSIAFLF